MKNWRCAFRRFSASQQRRIEFNPAVRLGIRGMTLAAILSVFILSLVPVPSLAALASCTQSAGQQVSPTKVPDASTPQQSQDKPAGSQEQNPSVSSPAATAPSGTSSGQNQPAPPKRRWHQNKKKKPTASDCNNSPTPTNSAAADTAPSGNSATANPSSATGAPSTPATATAPTNCPPAKIVVIHDGGTSEPAIQLTGGAGGEQSSNQRSTTDQLLASTEENLKKIAGRQLTPVQQEMVTQIRQFVDQSKAAVAAKDMERGHTLALKANLLSDELTKP